MENNFKLVYDAPTTLVIEVKTEGSICIISTEDYGWNLIDE